MGILADGRVPPSVKPVERVCALPVVGPPSPEEVEEISQANLLARVLDTPFRLKPEQAAGIQAFDRYGGLFGNLAVGCGKTLLTLMMASHAFRETADRVLLIIPSQMIYQLTKRDIGWARTKIPFGVPVFCLGGKPLKYRRSVAAARRPGLYILPFSCLSTADSEENLHDISPELVIIDEAHNVSKLRSARTRRLKRYLDERDPDLAVLSGTMTSKSIMDYHHLMRVALKENSPLPQSPILAQEWASVLDADGDASPSSSAIMPIRPLLDWSARAYPEEEIPWGQAGLRKAYRLRLHSAPGVAASSESKLGISLDNENLPAREPSQKLKALAEAVAEEMVTPDGDEIEHAIQTYKWLFELTAGMYNQLSWPVPEEFAERRRCAVRQAQELLDRAREHHDKAQVLSCEVRAFLSDNHIQGMDTPMLLRKEMANNGAKRVPAKLFKAWSAAKAAEFEGCPKRDSKVVWVDSYKIDHAVEWAALQQSKGHGCILWVYHIGVGLKLHERLPDAVYCPAGDAGNKRLLDPDNAGRILIASARAHGEGKDGLQHMFTRQMMVEWDRSARRAEQLLGRLHRQGQPADNLVFTTNRTNQFDAECFASCLNDSLYLHQTIGEQKLILCGYRPRPLIFPGAVLRERGFETKVLSPVDQAILDDLFETQN